MFRHQHFMHSAVLNSYTNNEAKAKQLYVLSCFYLQGRTPPIYRLL